MHNFAVGLAPRFLRATEAWGKPRGETSKSKFPDLVGSSSPKDPSCTSPDYPRASMNVLHLFAGNLFGGIERVGITLASHRALCPDMHPHFALCFEGRFSTELRATGVPIHMLGEVRLGRPWTILSARKRLKQVIREQKIQTVIAHACWPHVVGAPVVKAMGIPLIFWAHDILNGHHWIERWASRTSPALVLANSRLTAKSIPRVFPGVAVEPQFYPLPALNMPNRPAVRARVRAALGAKPDDVVIITACRMERWKGHTLLLDALGRLRKNPKWVCWIAGGAQRDTEQAYLTELQTAAEQGDIATRVKFLGQRSDVPELLVAADIHCQPNTGPEPFGIAFVEALYAGLPAVSTAMGGAMEIISAQCGILTPPDESTELASALKRLIDHPDERRALGAFGPQQASDLCNPRDTLHDLHRKLEILLPLESAA